MPRKGKSLRPVEVSGESLGKFRNPSRLPRRLTKLPEHPLVVCRDLQNGSLESLDAYLLKHGGIPDREVALELRKLIAGSSERISFRVVVVDHPDAPADIGGRPKSKHTDPTQYEVELAKAYETQFAAIGKVRLAREEAAKDMGVSARTIQRAVKKVEDWEASLADWQKVNDRRESALSRLRGQEKKAK